MSWGTRAANAVSCVLQGCHRHKGARYCAQALPLVRPGLVSQLMPHSSPPTLSLPPTPERSVTQEGCRKLRSPFQPTFPQVGRGWESCRRHPAPTLAGECCIFVVRFICFDLDNLTGIRENSRGWWGKKKKRVVGCLDAQSLGRGTLECGTLGFHSGCDLGVNRRTPWGPRAQRAVCAALSPFLPAFSCKQTDTLKHKKKKRRVANLGLPYLSAQRGTLGSLVPQGPGG